MLIKRIFLFFIKIYQKTLSPVFVSVFGRGCRYKITCSEYTSIMIKERGLFKGGGEAFKRFLSCNSFSS